MALLALGHDPNTTDPAQLEEAKNLLLELVPGVKLFDSDTPSTALLTGEADIGLIWNGEAAIAHSEDPAITYVYPEEGTIFWYDNLAIVKGAQHPEAAHAFMNYILRPEVSKIISDKFPYTNPNLAARKLLTPDQLANPASYPKSSNARTFRDIGKAAADIDKLVTDLKSAQ